MQDIFKVKGPITQWKDDYINYFLSGINKLFNKNYSKISDFLEDQTMLYFKDILNRTIKNSSTDLNIENRDKKQYASIGELLEFKLDPSINAYYDGEYNSVVLPLNGKISFGTVLHEINHALGNSKIGNKETNFNKASVGFNEIVNEYLTQQAMKNIKDEDKRDLSLGFKRDTGYQTGVAFMEKFLRKFEPILKKCQMSGNAPQVIKDFIGEKNFNTLMAMGDHLEKFNYGKVILPEDEIAGNLHDIVEDFRKNPNNNLYCKNSNELRMLVMMENFMDDMIEKYAEFEQGKITDIEIRADIENKVEQEIDE